MASTPVPRNLRVKGKIDIDEPLEVSAVSVPSIETDTISEKTAAAGVTIDGLLIKDGATQVDYWSGAMANNNQSIPNTTNTAIEFTELDSRGTSITALSATDFQFNVTGFYHITALVIANGTGTGGRSLQWWRTSDLHACIATTASGSVNPMLTVSGIVYVTAGETYQAAVWQNSGDALNFYPYSDTTKPALTIARIA